MSIYEGRARRRRDADLADIIADHPTQITRERKTHADKFRGAATATAGPYTVRIEGFKATRSSVTFDEKGTTATAAFVLVGLDIPRWQDADHTEATFAVDDVVTDADGNLYRVTSPARFDGRAVELNIELVG